MSNTAPELATCPFCGSAIPAEAVLIEYEIEDETQVFVECYECEEPVRPQ